MKHGSIVMAIVLLIGLGPIGRAQSVQTNGFEDWRARHHPSIGTNVSQGISRELLGAPSNHRLHTGFMTEIDSLRMKGPSSPFPIPNGFTRGTNLALARLSPQSQISVIDTAIVRSTGDTTRHLYSFNAKARMTSDLTQELIGDLWTNRSRETWIFDESNNMLSHLYEYWSNGQWVNESRYTYTYDANKNMLSELYESWPHGQWVNELRYTYTYDANGNRLSELNEYWSIDRVNRQWVIDTRYTYTYDANKNMLSDLYESYSNSQWVNEWRYTYTYDANGNNLSRLEEGWSNGQWVKDSRYTYTYDANGDMLSLLYETWASGQWVKQGAEYTYTYDANGHILSELGAYWPNGQLQISDRTTYTYDAKGNQTSSLSETWSNGQWVNGWRETYTYDAQENLTSQSNYSWLNSSWTPRDIGNGYGVFFVSDSAGNSYGLGTGYNFTLIRKLIVTGVASESGGGPASYSLSQNFPNPFNPSTTIRYGLPQRGDVSLMVFNTLGQQVATLVNGEQGAGNHEVRFDASALSSGVYFYRIQAGTFVETRKLLLLR